MAMVIVLKDKIVMHDFFYLQDKAYFHFMSSGMTILAKPVKSHSLYVGYELKNNEIYDEPIVNLLSSLDNSNLNFIYVGGYYIPVEPIIFNETHFSNFLKELQT